MPDRFGDCKNAHRRFIRWAETEVWQRVFEHLAADADNQSAMIDGNIVRARQHSADLTKGDDQAIVAHGED
jgi:hypothetical protein